MSIRRAQPDDLAAFRRIVEAAYAIYIPRLNRKPLPMLDDHAARIADGQAWVAEVEGAVGGVLVLVEQPDHLCIDNVAVDPPRRRTGLGRALLTFAEAEAARRGHAELRLVTNEAMVENVAMYRRIGYAETSRDGRAGVARVHFCKPLSGHTPEIAG